MTRPLSIVVLGLGRAGRARVQAVQDAPDWRLFAAESMRDGQLPASMSDPDVDAVCVCTENARHAELVAAALRAGKHVAVEYPLCATTAQAQALFDLQSQADRVVHTEVITLLSEGFSRFAAAVGGAPGRVHVNSEFAGGAYRWVGDEIAAGRIGALVAGRLHVVFALAPDTRVESVEIHESADDRFDVTVRLRSERFTFELKERRAPGLPRGWAVTASWSGGSTQLQRAIRGERLFARDLGVFAARIRGTSGPCVTNEAVLSVMQVADRIDAAVARSR